MDNDNKQNGSTLFLVRLWADEGSDGHLQWPGRVTHVITGRAASFQDWNTLVSQLREMAGGSEGKQAQERGELF